MARKKIFLSVLLFIPLLSNAQGGIDTLKYCVVDHSVGIGGYDPVSYFNSKEPVKGKSNITYTYDAIKYLFSNMENKASFEKNPEKYLPQFGGWCSMTLAMGRATQPVYDNYLIKDSKLYLFERTLSVNGQTIWKKNPVENKKRATSNYGKYVKTGFIQ